jgi:F-type H+-transporting ATPase subunit b
MLHLVLFVAVIILIVLVAKPFRQHVLGALDARSARIRAELDEAQRLHEEAKAMLAKYQRQLGEGEKLAADIVAQAETERARLEERMRTDFEAAVKRRRDQAMDRIAQEEQKALAAVRAHAADLAVRTARRLVIERTSDDEARAMVKRAIEDVDRTLN